MLLSSSAKEMAEARKIRPLTTAENSDVETRWIRRIRLNMWLQGGGAILCAILASGQKQKFVLILIAAVLGLIFLRSLRSLKLITRDLSAGAVEEILGSVQKREGSVLASSHSLIDFVPAIGLAADLAQTVLSPVALREGKFAYAVTAGFPLVLVKPHSTETIGVDRDTYKSFPDGALAKAAVLPLSRLALNVRRAGLEDI
jgi:hypothetical protein